MSAVSEASEPSNVTRKPWRLRFSLRALLIATTLIAMVLGWLVHQYRSFEGELAASEYLESRHSIIVWANHQIPERRPNLSISELVRGRIYQPIDDVFIASATLDAEAVQALHSFRYVRSMKIQDSSLPENVDTFGGLRSLVELDIRTTTLRNRDIKSITNLPRLKTLWLASRDHLPDDIADRIAGLHQLEDLALEKLAVSNDAMKGIGRMVQMRDLHLYGCSFSSDSVLHLADLKNLEYLSLQRTSTDDRLFQLAVFPKLDILWLDDCKITDDGLAGIARNQKLYNLSLQNTTITDRGMRHLPKLPRLIYLNVAGSQITSESLSTLRTMPSLKWEYVFTGLDEPQN